LPPAVFFFPRFAPSQGRKYPSFSSCCSFHRRKTAFDVRSTLPPPFFSIFETFRPESIRPGTALFHHGTMIPPFLTFFFCSLLPLFFTPPNAGFLARFRFLESPTHRAQLLLAPPPPPSPPPQFFNELVFDYRFFSPPNKSSAVFVARRTFP